MPICSDPCFRIVYLCLDCRNISPPLHIPHRDSSVHQFGANCRTQVRFPSTGRATDEKPLAFPVGQIPLRRLLCGLLPILLSLERLKGAAIQQSQKPGTLHAKPIPADDLAFAGSAHQFAAFRAPDGVAQPSADVTAMFRHGILALLAVHRLPPFCAAPMF